MVTFVALCAYCLLGSPAPVPKFSPLTYAQALPVAVNLEKPLVVGVLCAAPTGDWVVARSDEPRPEWGKGAFIAVFSSAGAGMRYVGNVSSAATAGDVIKLLYPAPEILPPPKQQPKPQPKITTKTVTKTTTYKSQAPPRGFHSHKCPQCGYVWFHTAASAGNQQAHTCAKCGEELPHPWYPYQRSADDSGVGDGHELARIDTTPEFDEEEDASPKKAFLGVMAFLFCFSGTIGLVTCRRRRV